MEGPLEATWRVLETADFLCKRGFKIVTLQFPDEHLPHASRVAVAVQAACAERGMPIQAYILADTTYNSLSVDEVAAAHVDAQCVVHYGRASLTKLSRLPAFFVFPEQQLDVAAAAACLAGSSLLAGQAGSGGGGDSNGSGDSSDGGSWVLVFLDQPLLHQLQPFKRALLELVERQAGTATAQRLVFPAVPRRHMEPAGAAACRQRQRQQAAAAAAAAGAGQAAGCCGGGVCGSDGRDQQQLQQPAAEKQQQPEPMLQEPPGPACCQGAAPCSSTPIKTQQPAAASLSGAAAESSAGDDGSGSGPNGLLHSLAGYEWRLPVGVEPSACGLAWVGAPDAPALLQLQLTYSGSRWAVVDLTGPSSAPAPALQEGLPLEISRALRRRYFLVEKARDASIVGILVGTLGAAGFGDAVAALRSAAAAAGKKSYTLLMGKPSPAKLANFPEIEVFVLVADPQGQILDSKEYLAPIITPHEAMLAWADGGAGGTIWDEQRYRLDFDGVAQQAQQQQGSSGTSQQQRRQEPRFSLLAGRYTGGGGSGSEDGSVGEEGEETGQAAAGEGAANPGNALALHAQQALQVTAAPSGRSDLVEVKSAADYFLHKRTWQGVEAPLVGAAPKAVETAVEGRSGRAAGYVDEPPRVAAVTGGAQQQQGQQQDQSPPE